MIDRVPSEPTVKQILNFKQANFQLEVQTAVLKEALDPTEIPGERGTRAIRIRFWSHYGYSSLTQTFRPLFRIPPPKYIFQNLTNKLKKKV